MPSDFSRHLSAFQDLLPHHAVTGQCPHNGEFARLVVRSEATGRTIVVDDLTAASFGNHHVRVTYAWGIAETLAVAPGGLGSAPKADGPV